MATPPPKAPVSRDALLSINISMLILTSLFIILRASLQISKRKPFELTDFFIYFAFALFVAMWTCYFAAIPAIFRIYAVLGGLTPPYATMMEDAAYMLRLITSGQMCFYTLLFSVKMSLLTLYRKLLAGLDGIYRKIWWGLVSYCLISWIGSFFSSMFTCNDMNRKFKQGKCGGTPNEDERIIFSLYMAYSVDAATDLAIIFLPLRLTWNLRLPHRQEWGIIVLFCSGFICIAFATLRVVQLSVDGRGEATIPEPKWLLLWTVLECAMAILIGCSPAFAILFRKRINGSKPSYNAQGYVKHSTNDIKLKSIVSSSGKTRRNKSDPYWDDTNSSQEELARNSGKITVKTTLHQDDEISSHSSQQKSAGESWAVEAPNGSGRVISSIGRAQ